MTPNQALRVIELLTEVRDGQRIVIELLEEQCKPVGGEAKYAPLIAAIRAAVGDHAFNSAELFDHCDARPELTAILCQVH
jgi:hypothetical protein